MAEKGSTNNGHPDDLEQRVKDLTTELEASNRALEAFSYSISHDLRAPLRKIGYFTELLTETYAGLLDGKGNEWLSKLDAQSKEMTHLIDVLLEFSRLERKMPGKTRIPVQQMVEDIARDAAEKESGRNIHFNIHPLPDALADVDLIRQVWIHLISNAIKFTVRKKETLIEIGAEEKAGTMVYYIKDNGVGFDMTYADKLFSPFQRLHPRSEFEGTGIGLATVERIIAKHNGRIWMEAKPDEGACFYFELTPYTS